MNLRGGGIALALLAGGCAVAPDTPRDPWDPDERGEALGVPADDSWCRHMSSLRASLDGAGPAPTAAARAASLAAVRAESDDPLWPFRKALICEYTQAAAEERAEYDWATARQFLDMASLALRTPPPEDGISPLVPVYDHLDGEEPESIAPVDLTNPVYCDAFDTSELALSQQRGGVVQAVGFPGSLQRAPDWFAMIQVSYHRWAREQIKGDHLIEEGAADFGGIPQQCRRFDAALRGSKAFSLKDNLIFLLPELDDPDKAGRLVVQDAAGEEIVLDRVLAAAQLDAGGTDGEMVDFYPEDLAASPGLQGAVNRANNLPPPRIFQIHFGYDSRAPEADDPQIEALKAELATRGPEEPLRVAVSGHADCVGPRWYNKMISDDRARAVFEQIVYPILLERGFDEAALRDRKSFRLSGIVVAAPAVKPENGCVREDGNRRVVVVVQ
ncbi:MAG: OmpA family protein [Pikeienuella sp.]